MNERIAGKSNVRQNFIFLFLLVSALWLVWVCELSCFVVSIQAERKNDKKMQTSKEQKNCY